MKRFKPIAFFSLCLLFQSCTAGRDYQRPLLNVPQAFKEQPGWKPATPDGPRLEAAWWKMFADPQLDALEAQIPANFSLAQAEAQYRQSAALVGNAWAAGLPRLNLTGTYNRFLSPTGQSPVFPGVRQIFNTALAATWELDLWGRIRRQIEAGEASAAASAATRDALRLSLQAQLAQNYLQLRTLDIEKRLLNDSVQVFRKTLELTRNRYDAGVVSKADVLQAETQLTSTEAQAIHLDVQRSQLEHALAVLIGKPPAELSLKASPTPIALPDLPATLPSTLLERRPDIAAAERQMMAANAQIGAARAAFFPNITLNANTGFQNNQIERLLTTASNYWALGPAAAALPLFEGGAKNTELKRSLAAYQASVAEYRQTVLSSFQDTEDQLATLRVLAEEAQALQQTLKTARAAVQLTTHQYRAGTVSFENVLIAQTAALSNERQALDIEGKRLLAAVGLIKALGGGWNAGPHPPATPETNPWRHYLPFPEG